MTQYRRIVKVFLGSPNDVSAERGKFKDILSRVNQVKANMMGFHFDSYSNSFSTDEIYTFADKRYTVSEQDITSDEEHDEGLRYSRYDFEIISE